MWINVLRTDALRRLLTGHATDEDRKLVNEELRGALEAEADPRTPKVIELATQRTGESDDINIETTPQVSFTDDGAWVQAWIWVPAALYTAEVPGIPAEVWSDDRRIEITFNAGPWFQQASDDEIRALIDCDWRGDYPADAVAQWSDRIEPEIKKVWNYISAASTDRNPVGFECSVDEEAARTWLAEHRPALIGGNQ